MTSERPLAGLKVVELARILAGPWAGQILADLGAEVIKIESPEGDETRRWGPPFVDNSDGTRDAAYFHATNRGKSSITLDFNRPADLYRLNALIADADILIENFRVGTLARYGLDHAVLSRRHPRLIYCSITGFGQDGPYAQRPGYDFVVQGMSGIMDLTGEPDGSPQKMGVAFADIMTGLYAVIAIQAALTHRTKTDLGQHIDMSLLDVMMSVLANQGLNYLVSGEAPSRLGNMHPNISPYEAFAAQDGWIVLAIGTDAQFHKLCEILKLNDVVADPRFTANAQRMAHRDALSTLIRDAIAHRKRDELLTALEKRGVPAGPINTVEQAFADPQVLHREIAITLTYPNGRQVPGIRLPISASAMALGTTTASPMLGSAGTQHPRS